MEESIGQEIGRGIGRDRDIISSERVENPEEPSRNKIRQITIEEVNRGYIVRVGCHTFAISTKEELIPKLSAYINEPDKTESRWFNKGEL